MAFNIPPTFSQFLRYVDTKSSEGKCVHRHGPTAYILTGEFQSVNASHDTKAGGLETSVSDVTTIVEEFERDNFPLDVVHQGRIWAQAPLNTSWDSRDFVKYWERSGFHQEQQRAVQHQLVSEDLSTLTEFLQLQGVPVLLPPQLTISSLDASQLPPPPEASNFSLPRKCRSEGVTIATRRRINFPRLISIIRALEAAEVPSCSRAGAVAPVACSDRHREPALDAAASVASSDKSRALQLRTDTIASEEERDVWDVESLHSFLENEEESA